MAPFCIFEETLKKLGQKLEANFADFSTLSPCPFPSESQSALLSSAFFSRAIEYFCIKDFINLVVRKGSEISNDPWRTGI